MQYLSLKTADILDVYQYYSFILIQECCGRVYVGCDMGMLYQQVTYAYNNKKHYLKEIFSNRTLFSICELMFKFEGNDVVLNDESPIKPNESLFKHETEKRFLDAMEKDINYFEKYIKKIDYEEFVSTRLEVLEDENVKYNDFAQYMVNLYLNKSDYNGIAKVLHDYINGKSLNESTEKIGNLLKLYDIQFATPINLLAYCKYILFSIGKLEDDNPYRKESIKALIFSKQEQCGDKTADVSNYIRLALYEGRDISISEANYCYIMLQEEKDYSVLWVPQASVPSGKKLGNRWV